MFEDYIDNLIYVLNEQIEEGLIDRDDAWDILAEAKDNDSTKETA